MRTRDTSKALWGVWVFLLPVLLLGVSQGFGAAVDENEAVAVADLWYAMELNWPHTKMDDAERTARFEALSKRQVLYLVAKDELLDRPPGNRAVLAYVIKYDPTGFVVVSGDDRIQPITVFNAKSEFWWDQPELNFLRYYLGKNMVNRWDHVNNQVAAGVDVATHANWSELRSRLQEDTALEEVSHDAPEGTIYVLWDTACWSQGTYYNAEVLAHNGNIAGIPTGCTATAMAIMMRFHEWPATGYSSHSYSDTWGSVQYSHSVNFGTETFSWGSMPTTSLTSHNAHVAELMYDCGVAVNMNYEVGRSGAWPSASATNTYFRYKGTIQRTSSHEAPIAASIRGGLPVVLSSSSHTVVACGYRDTEPDYFYMNAGHDGGGDGWYDLDEIPASDPTIDRSYPYSSPNNYIFVDAAWAGSENGNIQNPYNTLSEGVSAVPSGGRLCLKAGTYAEMTITKRMLITSYQGSAYVY